MRKFLTLAAAAAAVMFGASAHAVPTLIITLTDLGGGATTSCSITSAGFAGGCGAGFTLGGTNGVGNLVGGFSGLLGGYSINFTTNQTNAPGAADLGEINMSFTSIQNKSSAGSLQVSLAAFDFTLPSGPAMTLFGSQALSGNTNNPGTIGAQYFVSDSNANFASSAATASSSTSLLATTAASINAAPVNWMRTGPEFSAENILTFGLSIGGAAVNGSANLSVRNRIPEPMTTALVGLGLFGAAFFSRRRKAVTA